MVLEENNSALTTMRSNYEIDKMIMPNENQKCIYTPNLIKLPL